MSEHTPLKPCPFCGSDAYMVTIGNAVTKSRGTEIGCSNSLWHKNMRDNSHCGYKKRTMAIRQSVEWTQERAIAAWNRRAPDPVRDELVKALEAMEPFFRTWLTDFPTNGDYGFYAGSPKECHLGRSHAQAALAALAKARA